MKYKNEALSLLLVLSVQMNNATFAAGPVDETALRNAWNLYTQQKFAASADAFEVLIRTATPNPRLYYYAAVANKSNNRPTRAKQLAQYVITNFPTSAEAGQFQKLFPEFASKSTIANEDLPENLKGKKFEELMQTEEGRKALQEMLKKQSGAPTATISSASQKRRDTDRVVEADAVAIDGADGITHFARSHPDAWIESAMAALAMLPRGHKLLSDMIKNPGGRGTFVVRFPNDSQEFQLTPQKVEEMHIKDKAEWATLIHCAIFLKLMREHSHLIEDGLTILTGKKAEALIANSTTEQALSKFIEQAIKAQNPIVCNSNDDFGTMPELTEAATAFTITDFDTASGMITIRNPHGSNSRRFRLETDPQHKKFEQLNSGVFKMHITLFSKYFDKVARSTI